MQQRMLQTMEILQTMEMLQTMELRRRLKERLIISRMTDTYVSVNMLWLFEC